MATVMSTLALQDKMSKTFTNIDKAALQDIQTFNNMQKEVDNLKKALEDAEKANPKIVETDMYLEASDALREMEDHLHDVASGEAELDVQNKKLGLSITDLNQGLEILNKAWDGMKKVMSEVNELVELNNNQFNAEYTAATKLRTMLGASPEDIQSMYDYAGALQQVGVIGDEAIISGMGIMATSASSTDSLKKLSKAAADAAVGINGLETDQSSYESMAGYFQRALEGSASQLVRNKVLTQQQADQIDKLNSRQAKEAALIKAVEQNFGDANKVLSETAQGGIMQANNALGDMGETIGESVTPYISAFKTAITDMLAPAIQWVADNMNWIAPIFLTLAAVIGIVIIALTLYAAWNAIVALSELAVFWPILLIIAAILIVIGIIFILVDAWNYWTDSSVSTVGVIMGIIYSLAAFVYNTFIVPIWNAIAALVNFFANCFKDPVASIKILFLDLVTTITNLLASLASIIDKIFGSHLADTVNGWTNNLNQLKEDIKAESDYEEVMGKLENWEYSDAWNAGYSMGENIEKGISEGVGGLDIGKMVNGLGDLSNMTASVMGTDSLGGNALKTTSNDEVEISDEDIQLLLDIATRDYKLNYQQVTPNITLTFGDIHETADVDDILDEVADKLQEIYDGNLEVS